jgi:glycosyltransferase involved in cell wall biosynthesis
METLPKISVVIPVGPNPVYKKWLRSCIASVHTQTYEADEILLIDDMAHLDRIRAEVNKCMVWKTPWLSGVAHAFNFGVALARNECVFMLGSDDKLYPECLEKVAKAYVDIGDELGYYGVTCDIQDYGYQDLLNNAAMVTKSLWNHTGGFPIPQAAMSPPDAMLLSIMMYHMQDHLHKVDQGNPLYWVRRHPDQAGHIYNQYPLSVNARDKITREWRPPKWTKP